MHAYLRTTGLTGRNLQENAIAETYQSQLESALLSLFSNLDPTEARALSWGGLTDTPAWANYQSNNPSAALNLQSLNAQHRVNTKRTSCN